MAQRTTTVSLQQVIDLLKANKVEEADRLSQLFFKQYPDDPGVLHVAGLVAVTRGRFEPASELFNRALAGRPGSPAYHHNYATTLAALGQLDEAERHYRKAIALDPSYAEAYYNLVTKTKIEAGDSLIEPLEQLLAKDDLSQQNRIFACFAAGKIYEDLGDADKAFAYYRCGNEARAVAWDPAVFDASVDKVMEVFDAGFFAERRNWGLSDNTLVFIVGMPRSGSTLVEQILASRPDVFGAGEIGDIPAIGMAMAGRLGSNKPWPDVMTEVPAGDVNGFADSFVTTQRAKAPDAVRIVDKNLRNYLRIGMIHLMFPNAAIIHCRRDALDTCLSCYFQNFIRHQDFSFDLGHIGRFYNAYRRVMAHWQDVLPGRVFDLDYEALVADQEGETRRLIDHVGLAWDDASLEPEENIRFVRTASMWQARQPVYKTSVKKSDKYKAYLGPLIEVLDGGL